MITNRLHVGLGKAALEEEMRACGDPKCCGGGGEYIVHYDWPLMQFTGLHDKNGKEIYEGDIVELGGDADGWWGGEVKYDGDEAKFYVEYDDFDRWDDIGQGLLVRGNIYENSELLGEQQISG